MLDKKFWDKLSLKVIPRYRKHIFGTTSGGKKAKDVYGKSYPVYKDKGIRKRLGVGKRQSAKYKDSNAPVFTGDLLRDFKLRQTSSKGFSFGTTSHGGKAKHLEEMGRVIASDDQPLPKDIMDLIIREAGKEAMKDIDKNIKSRKFSV